MNTGDDLKRFLDGGTGWERMQTTVAGIGILRMPASGARLQRLAVEVNPVTPRGTRMKRRGLIIRTVEELEAFRSLLSSPRLEHLMDGLADVNPVPPPALTDPGKEGGSVLEI
ncbi:MAG: hypothetical protein LUO86_00755 [Methanomicrobiales archaeon]|nr:hypothetical protein [Methanomicrobiales archaeon]MDD1655208.1 hypothetical protein [Methanomicrobiales archaeon]